MISGRHKRIISSTLNPRSAKVTTPAIVTLRENLLRPCKLFSQMVVDLVSPTVPKRKKVKMIPSEMYCSASEVGACCNFSLRPINKVLIKSSAITLILTLSRIQCNTVSMACSHISLRPIHEALCSYRYNLRRQVASPKSISVFGPEQSLL
jgi:hypothetical protein